MVDIVRYQEMLFPKLQTKMQTKDGETANYLKERIEELAKIAPGSPAWTNYRNFWPPTIIDALRERRLIFFMGAGTSAAAGPQTWRQLLEERFGIPVEFLHDENLKNDNLTLGEIASRLVGREQLQSMLRSAYNAPADPTAIHYCLAALDLPVYMTTNYDMLFENAWKKIYGKEIDVICNASDAKKSADAPNRLFKIHGSAGRLDELLVLTRSEYRRHYRLNAAIFDEIRDLIQANPTVFTGFSHTDPEIGRLIDDIIYHFEHNAAHSTATGPSPYLYNMQFENDYVTNERFAAKGMVSLNVRLVTAKPGIDARTGGVSEAISELVSITESKMDEVTSVDTELTALVTAIKTDLDRAIGELSRNADPIRKALASRPVDKAAVSAILNSIDIDAALGTQGVYLVDFAGSLVEWNSGALDKPARDKIIDGFRRNFGQRPYFQMSKSFRKPFVSDFFESIFNKNATFAICMPITLDETFHGLLFSACQIGQWKTPIEAVRNVRNVRNNEGLGAYVLDGQGMVALPPNGEFDVRVSQLMANEPELSRTGYDHVSLKILSKKDRIISRLAENIVPIQKDDDILSLDKELEIYARIENIGVLGWRCAVSRTIRFARARQ